jgi:hypothetical protein
VPAPIDADRIAARRPTPHPKDAMNRLEMLAIAINAVFWTFFFLVLTALLTSDPMPAHLRGTNFVVLIVYTYFVGLLSRRLVP